MEIKKNKTGIFYSSDALIALTIILLSILIIYPILTIAPHEDFVHRDIMKVISSLKIGEIENTEIESIISQGLINDLNKSILEQLGEFYVTNKTLARTIAESLISGIDTQDNFGIWFGNELIASKNSSPFEYAENIDVKSQLISGIREGESITGFSGRAFLSNSLQKKYFNFGGYVGEGNLSARIYYTGEIDSVILELAIINNFDVYVNNVYSGSYTGSVSQFIPKNYSIPIDNFESGENIIEFRGDNLNIAGGFIKVTYIKEIEYEQPKRYYFPGISGIINLYDGFYIPGELNSMNIFLHLNSNQTTFLKIGNTTVYNASTNGDEEITISDAQLELLLNYDELSEKTVPLRLGLTNVSYVSTFTRPADVFSVTDLSGSMAPTGTNCAGENWFCCWGKNCNNNQANCESCGGTFEPATNKLQSAKDANKIFINAVLNNSANRVGLAGYKATASDSDFHQLSNNNASLISEVNSWTASGNTCICCGINKAKSNLVNHSSSEKFRSIIVMSDGEANVQCSEQGTGNAKQDAIQAACDAFNDYGIRVYSVGFGSDADESTLQSVANCGNGSYYYSSVEGLVDVYREIAQEMIEATYFEQTISIIGTFYSKLYPDSYIEFDYNETTNPPGLITTNEKKFSDAYSGSFSLPANATILETRVISYSGPRWTQKVEVNNSNVYDIGQYGSNYIEIGDPYSVNIPNPYISAFNFINLTTGISSSNSSAGSEYNKIIYTIAQDLSAYSSLSAFANGCIWTVEFEDNSQLIDNIPEGNTVSEYCYHTSGGQNISNENDALQITVRNLLRLLDFDSDGKLDIKFSEQDLEISSSELTGIPYDWSTEVQVRIWR